MSEQYRLAGYDPAVLLHVFVFLLAGDYPVSTSFYLVQLEKLVESALEHAPYPAKP